MKNRKVFRHLSGVVVGEWSGRRAEGLCAGIQRQCRHPGARIRHHPRPEAPRPWRKRRRFIQRRAADRAPGPLLRHRGAYEATSGGSAETARQAAQSGKRVWADQPTDRSERDPADRPDVTRELKGLRGPTAHMAAHREGG